MYAYLDQVCSCNLNVRGASQIKRSPLPHLVDATDPLPHSLAARSRPVMSAICGSSKCRLRERTAVEYRISETFAKKSVSPAERSSAPFLSCTSTSIFLSSENKSVFHLGLQERGRRTYSRNRNHAPSRILRLDLHFPPMHSAKSRAGRSTQPRLF